jgi:hypothetical protein
MTQFLFMLTFPLAAPFWAMMIFVPNWQWTRRIIESPLIILPPLLVYLLVMIPIFPLFWAAVSAPDLAVLQQVLGSPAGSATVWAQLIAFDLFIGRWMYRDSRARGISPWLMGPLLLLTILLSPVGLLGYLVLRAIPSVRSERQGLSAGFDRPITAHPVVY